MSAGSLNRFFISISERWTGMTLNRFMILV